MTDESRFEPIDPALAAMLATDPVADFLGIRFDSIRAGYARATMLVTERLLNAPGTAHGGVMMALVDVVHAAVSNSHGTLAVAQDVHTEFLNAGSLGDTLVCEGVEINRTGRTAVYRIDVHAFGEKYPDGRHIATALARVFRVGTPWVVPEAAPVADAAEAAPVAEQGAVAAPSGR